MSSLLFGQILAILVAITSAEKSLLFSHLGKKVSTRATVHIRLWIALPLIILSTLISEGTAFLQVSLQTWLILLLSGVIGFFICDSFAFWAFANIGAREAMVIMTLNPIFHSILSYFFFSEVLSFYQILSILITISGIIILILAKNKKSDNLKKKNKTKGILFAFLGALFQAISNIIAKSALDTLYPLSLNTIRMIGGFIAAVVFAIFVRKEFIKDFKSYKSVNNLALLALASISGPIIGITILLAAFNYAPVGLVTAIAQISPIFILVYELVFLKKRISLLEIIGTLISVLGVSLMFI
ncbi:MAG: DMT family transporter [Sphaerochaetaceae bacterium]|nr:DMT family transporter [Sphaerochaetaceae bacterium]